MVYVFCKQFCVHWVTSPILQNQQQYQVGMRGLGCQWNCLLKVRHLLVVTEKYSFHYGSFLFGGESLCLLLLCFFSLSFSPLLSSKRLIFLLLLSFTFNTNHPEDTSTKTPAFLPRKWWISNTAIPPKVLFWFQDLDLFSIRRICSFWGCIYLYPNKVWHPQLSPTSQLFKLWIFLYLQVNWGVCVCARARMCARHISFPNMNYVWFYFFNLLICMLFRTCVKEYACGLKKK